MPKFFLESDNPENGYFKNDTAVILGKDAIHISKVLRVKPGEKLTVCDCIGNDYFCEVIEARQSSVTLKIIERKPSLSEPSVAVTLFQGLPKGDKMDFIVQKSVELGVVQITPVLTMRSVSKPDTKTLLKKTERWNRIAAEAAKQSGRSILPKVQPAVDFKTAVKLLAQNDKSAILYEQNGGTMGSLLANCKNVRTFGIFVGPEGGFDETEVSFAYENGIMSVGMGPRILRTETAPLCALSVIMYSTGNL